MSIDEKPRRVCPCVATNGRETPCFGPGCWLHYETVKADDARRACLEETND